MYHRNCFIEPKKLTSAGILTAEVSFLSRKKKDPGFPYDATPDVHRFTGNADSCFDMVNQYGTYEIQRTQDTENIFPLIMQGLPREWENIHMDKPDVENEE